MRFSQVRLLVDDFGAAFGFYRDELGLEVSSGDESSGYASFTAGGGAVAIFDRAGQADVVELRPPGDSTLAVLEVDDVDGVLARLAEFAVGQASDQEDWGGRVGYLRDPSGNLIELFQVLPAAE